MPTISGDEVVACQNTIATVTVGSRAFGLADDNSDHDVMGVYVETPEQVMGLSPSDGHWVWRSVGVGAPSLPGDIDQTSYSLRKYVKLAKDGNPNILTLLWGEGFMTDLGHELQGMACHIVSMKAIERSFGWFNSEMKWLESNRDGHRWNKRAAHTFRLVCNALDLAKHGAMKMPMSTSDVEQYRVLREGEGGYSNTMEFLSSMGDALLAAAKKSSLQTIPNHSLVDKWLVEAHQRYWKETVPGFSELGQSG